MPRLGTSARPDSSVRPWVKSKLSELERQSGSWVFPGTTAARVTKTYGSLWRLLGARPLAASSLSLPNVHR